MVYYSFLMAQFERLLCWSSWGLWSGGLYCNEKGNMIDDSDESQSMEEKCIHSVHLILLDTMKESAILSTFMYNNLIVSFK